MNAHTDYSPLLLTKFPIVLKNLPFKIDVHLFFWSVHQESWQHERRRKDSSQYDFPQNLEDCPGAPPLPFGPADEVAGGRDRVWAGEPVAGVPAATSARGRRAAEGLGGVGVGGDPTWPPPPQPRDSQGLRPKAAGTSGREARGH